MGLTEQMTYNGYLLPASSMCLTRNAMRTTLADVAPRNARDGPVRGEDAELRLSQF